jgi:hypothetical protein
MLPLLFAGIDSEFLVARQDLLILSESLLPCSNHLIIGLSQLRDVSSRGVDAVD